MKQNLNNSDNERGRVQKKIYTYILVISVLLSSCAVSVEESPESLGISAGEIFAEEWNSRNDSGAWPDSTVAAMYCADVISDFNPNGSWTMNQQFEFTDACAAAIVDNLE